MELTATIALMLILVLPDGSTEIEMRPQPSEPVCWNAARRFIRHTPSEFGAIALGAGCIINPESTGASN